MDLQSSFVDDLLHAEDEYEVMALCYNKLLEYAFIILESMLAVVDRAREG